MNETTSTWDGLSNSINIPIRVKQLKKTNSKREFSVLEGLKNLWYNLKILFTERILTGGNAWYKITGTNQILGDFSLIWKEGKPEFIKTPVGKLNIGLEVSQVIEDENLVN